MAAERKMQRHKEKTVAALMCSLTDGLDLVNGHKLGANSYVRKPVDFIQFSEAVRQLGIYWLLLNQPPPSLRRA
jgi:DNA-binding response OmpR family regulator